MSEAPFSKLRFLVVDDIELFRNLYKRELKRVGVEAVHEAGDGAAAWQILEDLGQTDSPVEFIICDWNMPRMSGMDLLKRCRSHAVYNNVGFILSTNVVVVDKVKQAVMAGVDDYLIKPFTPAAMHEKIMKVYKKRWTG